MLCDTDKREQNGEHMEKNPKNKPEHRLLGNFSRKQKLKISGINVG